MEEAELILQQLMTFEVCQQMCINQTYATKIPTATFSDAHWASYNVSATCTESGGSAVACAYADESNHDGCPDGCNDDGQTCTGTATPPLCDFDDTTGKPALLIYQSPACFTDPCDFDDTTEPVGSTSCPSGCAFTEEYTPWVNRSEIMYEQVVPCVAIELLKFAPKMMKLVFTNDEFGATRCVGIEFFPKWASAIWNASTCGFRLIFTVLRQFCGCFAAVLRQFCGSFAAVLR